MSKVIELFGHSTTAPSLDWSSIVRGQHCPYLARQCIKTRKSSPRVSIGTCTVAYGDDQAPVVICPLRFLERHHIFTDCVHLLTLHEPGNEFHVVPEISIPGGHIDYVLGSVRNNQVKDFVAIEVQTLDTTGTLWPQRQRFLRTQGIKVRTQDADSGSGFGMNWKMTAKTTLMQLHHKIQTFEHVHRHLVLVLQDRLLSYMRDQFSFEHLSPARLGDPMHLHAYRASQNGASLRLELSERLSTDSDGIATCLGLQASARVELSAIIDAIQSKICDQTRLALAGPSARRGGG